MSSYNVFQDWSNNKNNFKGKLVLVAFRVAHIGSINRLLFFLLLPYLIIYRIVVEWFLCIELPYKTCIAEGLVMYHGQALVVNDRTIIGRNCTIRHSTTIGNKLLPNGSFSNSPVIGDNVDIGSNVCIIGPVTVGNNVVVGAGCIITKNVPANSVVVGNPAKIIKVINI